MEGLAISLYFSPVYPVERALPLGKKVIEVLRRTEDGFQPQIPRDAALLAADRDEGFETLFGAISIVRSAPGVPDFVLFVSQVREEPSGWAAVRCDNPLLRLARAEVDRSWSFMVSAAPRVIEATCPVFAEINAVGESGIRFNKLVPGALPPVFGPWNYLGPSLLTGDRRAVLQALPGCKVSALAEGLVLQLVPDLYAKPGRELTAALRSLGVKYHAKRPPDAAG